MSKPNPDRVILSPRNVATLAVKVGEMLGVQMPAKNYFLDRLNESGIKMPIIYKSKDIQFWVDCEYIAYSRYDEDDIHYVYITRQHISEERASYRETSKERKEPNCIPQQVSHVFRKALSEMNLEKTDYTFLCS
jgi:hypothetical protein